MNSEELIPFLQKCELTQSLSEEEIKQLLPFIEDKFFEINQIIFNEGEESRDLYLVKSGNLEIFKKVEDREEAQELQKLGEGAFFGEMAHLENEKRSASVRSTDKSELLILRLDDLGKAQEKELLYAKIIAQLGRKVSQNLRRTDQTLIDSLKDKLKIMQAYTAISKTLIHLIVLMAVWFNLSQIVELFPTYRHTLDLIFTTSLFILFAVSIFYLIKSSGYPLSFYGLTLDKWLRSSVEAVVYSIPIMVFFLILKWVLINHTDLFSGVPLFASIENLKGSLLLLVIYIVLSPVQEMIARGCIQSSFRNFFQGPNRAFMAILVSNLIFQMLHTVKEFWLAMASLVLGFFWGYLFEKQKSVIGVSVSHALIGTWCFFILGYDVLFEIAAASRGT